MDGTRRQSSEKAMAARVLYRNRTPRKEGDGWID